MYQATLTSWQMFCLRVVHLRTVLRLTQAAAEFGPEEHILLYFICFYGMECMECFGLAVRCSFSIIFSWARRKDDQWPGVIVEPHGHCDLVSAPFRDAELWSSWKSGGCRMVSPCQPQTQWKARRLTQNLQDSPITFCHPVYTSLHWMRENVSISHEQQLNNN